MSLRPLRIAPQVPDIEATRSGRPAAGELFVQVVEGLNHLTLTRRRGVHHHLTQVAALATTTPIGVNQDVEVIIKTTPGARHIWIGFNYQMWPHPANASERATLGDPIVARVDATLYDHDAGVIIDGAGCRWDYIEETLAATAQINGVNVLEGELVEPDLYGAVLGTAYAHTTRRVSDGAAAITRPRCLTVPAAVAGKNIRIRLQSTNTRILSVDAGELDAESVTL